ncbi:MAG: T9SS type A sorting domain-containing protein [Ignavibacteria bacterium]|nr:T9SS type A sorting domain-containing protein [Ignavibacteria bacterium]MBK9183252.1 T9SS type A sorting domain-containing protein [Ignavibacteria bacterium]
MNRQTLVLSGLWQQRHILLAVAITIAAPMLLFSQDAILAVGAEYSTLNISVSQSIGCIGEGEIRGRNAILTSGVQQAFDEDSSATGVTSNHIGQCRALVYPNPATEYVEVRSEEGGLREYGVIVYSHLGVALLDVRTEERIWLANVASGLYFLRIQHDCCTTWSVLTVIK